MNLTVPGNCAHTLTFASCANSSSQFTSSCSLTLVIVCEMAPIPPTPPDIWRFVVLADPSDFTLPRPGPVCKPFDELAGTRVVLIAPPAEPALPFLTLHQHLRFFRLHSKHGTNRATSAASFPFFDAGAAGADGFFALAPPARGLLPLTAGRACSLLRFFC